MSIYTDAKAAGIPIDSHESDLYLLDCAQTRELLRKHGVTTAEGFTSEIDGCRWLDVPFRFDPFWERKTP